MTVIPLPAPRPSAAPVAPSGASSSDAAQRRIALEFEAQILGAMLQPMFSGTQGGAFGGGAGEATWQPMLVTEYGKAFARAGGVGLAEHVVRALQQAQRTQEGGNGR